MATTGNPGKTATAANGKPKARLSTGTSWIAMLAAGFALAGPAHAACSDNAPDSDETVVCDDSAPDPDTVGVQG
ncbi:MAG: hypothetical protein KDE25_15130, partial [Novosphingobium sp.]|nr:hypothetical protein [Novosphingobium sp.]